MDITSRPPIPDIVTKSDINQRIPNTDANQLNSHKIMNISTTTQNTYGISDPKPKISIPPQNFIDPTAWLKTATTIFNKREISTNLITATLTSDGKVRITTSEPSTSV